MSRLNKSKNISIAVLPFKVINKNERLRTLIHGLTEDLITNLSKFVGISVISQLSTEQITDISDYGEIDKLSADFLVVGSVRTVVDMLRITIQLINANDRSVEFSDQLDKSVGEIFDTRDAMVQQIVSALQKEIDFNLLSDSYKKEEVELAAYENWLLGMDCLKKGTSESDASARDFFDAALKIDPHYAPAYTGLSLSYFNEWSCQVWGKWEINMNGAHKYALKAVDLDKNDYRALAILGKTYIYMGEFEKAEHCIRKSLRMNPNDADNLIQIAFCMMYLGYPQEALEQYLKAVELDPFRTDDSYLAYGSQCYFEIGDFERSIELAVKTDVSNFWTDLPAYVAAAYFHLSDYDKMWEYWGIYLKTFEENIYSVEKETSKKSLEEEALSWQINVNPYKNDCNLTPFWNYIKDNKRINFDQRSNDRRQAETAKFSFLADVWHISFQEQTVLIKDAKGLHDIHKLLADPNIEYHSMELMGSVIDSGTKTATLDSQAKSEYHNRIRELQSNISEAEEMNDITRVSILREEYDAILDHLSTSLGLNGKSREIGSTAEKARSAITWRIRSALKKIEKSHPALAKHLSKSIKTGTFCCYQPEVNIDWQL